MKILINCWAKVFKDQMPCSCYSVEYINNVPTK